MRWTMATNYKINGTDIEDIFESFTLAEQQEGGRDGQQVLGWVRSVQAKRSRP